MLSDKGILYTQPEYKDDSYEPTSTSIFIKSNNEEPKTICNVEGEAKCTQQYGDNIYFAAKNEIYSVDFAGKNKEAVLTADNDIAAFNIHKGILYYVDLNGGIFSFNLETKETNKIKDTTLDTELFEYSAQLYITPNNLMVYENVDYEVIPLTQADK